MQYYQILPDDIYTDRYMTRTCLLSRPITILRPRKHTYLNKTLQLHNLNKVSICMALLHMFTKTAGQKYGLTNIKPTGNNFLV